MFGPGPVEYNWLLIFVCLILEGLFLLKLIISNKISPTKNKLRFLTHGSLLVVLIFLFLFTDEVTRHYLLQGKKGEIFLVNGTFKITLVGAIGLSILNEFLLRKKHILPKEESVNE